MINKDRLKTLKSRMEYQTKLELDLSLKKEDFSLQNKELLDEIDNTSEEIEGIKTILFTEGTLEFKETGSKKLTGGLSIRESVSLTYDQDLVLAWCKTNMPIAVVETVNKKVFELYIKDNPEELKKTVERIKEVKVCYPKEIKIEGEDNAWYNNGRLWYGKFK